MHIYIYNYIYLKLAIHCQTLKIANETGEFGIVIFFYTITCMYISFSDRPVFLCLQLRLVDVLVLFFLKKKHLPIKEYFQTLTV